MSRWRATKGNQKVHINRTQHGAGVGSGRSGGHMVKGCRSHSDCNPGMQCVPPNCVPYSPRPGVDNYRRGGRVRRYGAGGRLQQHVGPWPQPDPYDPNIPMSGGGQYGGHNIWPQPDPTHPDIPVPFSQQQGDTSIPIWPQPGPGGKPLQSQFAHEPILPGWANMELSRNNVTMGQIRQVANQYANMYPMQIQSFNVRIPQNWGRYNQRDIQRIYGQIQNSSMGGALQQAMSHFGIGNNMMGIGLGTSLKILAFLIGVGIGYWWGSRNN